MTQKMTTMIPRSSEPYDLAEAYDYMMEQKLAKRPICTCCGEPCQGDTLFYNRNIIVKGAELVICESCLEDFSYDPRDWDDD